MSDDDDNPTIGAHQIRSLDDFRALDIGDKMETLHQLAEMSHRRLEAANNELRNTRAHLAHIEANREKGKGEIDRLSSLLSEQEDKLRAQHMEAVKIQRKYSEDLDELYSELHGTKRPRIEPTTDVKPLTTDVKPLVNYRGKLTQRVQPLQIPQGAQPLQIQQGAQPQGAQPLQIGLGSDGALTWGVYRPGKSGGKDKGESITAPTLKRYMDFTAKTYAKLYAHTKRPSWRLARVRTSYNPDDIGYIPHIIDEETGNITVPGGWDKDSLRDAVYLGQTYRGNSPSDVPLQSQRPFGIDQMKKLARIPGRQRAAVAKNLTR